MNLELKVISNKNRQSKSKLYVFVENETILENLENRYNRPYNTYKKEVIPEFLEKLNKEFNLDLSKCKFSWNQYAGCACGCSPGFIINGSRGLEFFATIK